MTESFHRIYSVLWRYLYLHQRSISRTLELIFWPVMELMVWGYVQLYLRSLINNPAGKILVFFISAMIFWDILYRSQQGVSISFIEDIWTQNILNVLISPLRLWEWLAATFLYGFIKTILITTLLTVISYFLYHYNLITSLSFYLIPLVINLFLFGWVLGVFTSGLLLRWGHAVEALIWGVPFLMQPLSAIFYPLSILPKWLQYISLGLPSTYIFEGMRAGINTGSIPSYYFVAAFGLNIVYFILASLFFRTMYIRSRTMGRLGRLGLD